MWRHFYAIVYCARRNKYFLVLEDYVTYEGACDIIERVYETSNNAKARVQTLNA